MVFLHSPFFWALMSTLGMVGAQAAVSGLRLGRNRAFVALVLGLVTAGRVLLVLPFCPQPRFAVGPGHAAGAAVLFLLALGLALPGVLRVRWWAPPEQGMVLRTTGVHALVRHPIYLAEILWALALATIFGSVYGIALTPVWWFAFWLHSLAEEAALERLLGSVHAGYKRKVTGRILPGLPL